MAMREGFICSLCKQDLQSFQHLEAHFREEHSNETAGSKLKTNFRSFLDKAKTSLGKKPQFQLSFKPQSAMGGVDEGASAAAAGSGVPETPALVEAHVTNVSGFDLEAWPLQEFGEFDDKSK